MSILKWVGGKSQILSELFNIIPEKINTYYEPFIGGGSVLIKLLEECENGSRKVKNFIVNDINSELINVYKNIKLNHILLIENLETLNSEFKNLPEIETEKRKKIIPPDSKSEVTNRKIFYYFIRNQFNKKNNSSVLQASYFIFLNKTGFRGLYRENSNKEFNVPYGNYKNPAIQDKKKIIRLNYLFNKYSVKFKNKSFIEIKIPLNKKDFVYLDPPYYPINNTSFTGYSAIDFNLQSNKILIKQLNEFNENSVRFLMSNSYTDWILKKSQNFYSKQINCKRRINSKNPESQALELLVFNFQ